MKPLTCAVATALALLAFPGDGQGADAITQPDWIEKPTGEDLMQHYPRAAAELSIEGHAVLTCVVDSFGRLDPCRIVSEAPPGLGFGAAALVLAPSFRMRPMIINGQPTAGGRVSIPINFRMAADQAPPPARLAGSRLPTAGGLALARRLVDYTELVPQMTRDYLRGADELELLDDQKTPVDTRGKAAAALRAAVQAHQSELRDWLTQAYASVFSESELQQVMQFAGSPGGAVVLAPNAGLQAISTMLMRDSRRRAMLDAGARFCAAHDCELSRLLKAQAASPATIEAPIWGRQPDEAELAAAAPPILRLLGLNSGARLICKIDALARLEACSVSAEAPAGLGVGFAALNLSRAFRLSPVLMSQGARGETVAVTVVFPAPQAEQPFEAPQPRSARALQLAREVVRPISDSDARALIEASTKPLAENPPQGFDPRTYASALEALRTAAAQTWPAQPDQLIATYAALFTEDQLASAAAFRKSAAFEALLRGRHGLQEPLANVALRAQAQISADARAIFCRGHPCAVKPASAPQPAALDR